MSTSNLLRFAAKRTPQSVPMMRSTNSLRMLINTTIGTQRTLYTRKIQRSSQSIAHTISFRDTLNLPQKFNVLGQKRTYSSNSYPPHTVIAMPALSPTMTQGNIGQFHKKVGDSIQPGDVLVEIETDKAQMDFECQEEGYLAKILIEPGQKDVPVNTPIAVFVEDEADIPKFKDFTISSQEESAPSSTVVDKSAIDSSPVKESKPSTEKGVSASTEIKSSESEEMLPSFSTGRIFASPLAKNLAADKGIPLNNLSGSGPGGRIVKADVEGYKAPAPAVSTVAPSPVAPGATYVDIPLSNVRKVIASRLTSSKQNIPHYYLTSEITMDKIIKLREVLNREGASKYKLSMNDFIVKAASFALRDVPEVNSSWNDTFIRQFKNVDIAVAVATETGLITPIVKDANLKGLKTISNSIKEMASRAKENKLAPHEYQGGTFTVSNLGMFDISHFTAIINPPHSAILAVGNVEQKLVLDNTAEKGFSVTEVMKVTLSCDHRVVDGAVGSRWLQRFKSYLEQPLSMLL